MGKIVAAIPTNRPELCKEAVEAWRKTNQFDEIWVMWDGPSMEAKGDYRLGADHIFFGPDYENIIPRKSSCCRSRLVLEAWKDPEVEWLVHLDDDVRHPSIEPHIWPLTWRRSLEGMRTLHRWCNTTPPGCFARGLPVSERWLEAEVKVVHAFAFGMPDILGFDQLSLSKDYKVQVQNVERSVVVPPGMYFPMSSQAVAIHRDLFPASYFLWMGWDLPLNKFGDIWCGVILKKICDHFGWACVINEPVVEHKRASDPWKNMEAEAPMLKYNEDWWKCVDAVDLSLCIAYPKPEDVKTLYWCIAKKMYMPEDLDQDPPKFRELREKMLQWISLFE